MEIAPLSRTDIVVIEYAIRRPQGVTDNSIAVDLGLIVGTANNTRFRLVAFGFLEYRGRRTRTSNGGTACVFELSDPAVTSRVPNMTLPLEEKDAALSRLLDVFDFLKSHGCLIPDELVYLSNWLRTKLLQADKRRASEH